MQWAFYRIAPTGGQAADEFNRFLRSVRVLTVHREFVAQGDASFWALAVEYLPAEGGQRVAKETATGKVDFKALLPPEDFALFARLREWRKTIGNREAVPVYTIFTNEQLAEMARRRCTSPVTLGEIEGIGQGRLERYGTTVIEIIKEFTNGTGTGTLPEDSRT